MKIANAAHQIENPSAEQNPATAHLFIINPLTGGHGWDNLFATHPSTREPDRGARSSSRRKWAWAVADLPARRAGRRRRQPAARAAARGAPAAADPGAEQRPRYVARNSRREFVPHERMNSPASSPEPQGLASRRIASDILEGVLRRGRSLDDQLDGGGAHHGLAALRRARPRARPPAGRDGAAPPRHAAPSARPLSRPRHPEGLAAGRDRAAARRGPDSLARRARPRGGRPVGAAGRSRTGAMRAMPGWSTPCCAVLQKMPLSNCAAGTPSRSTPRTG